MKKILILLLLVGNQCVAAKEIPQYHFIKIWNFLKYYHPDLATGRINADSLFLLKIEKAADINYSIALLTENLKGNFKQKPPAKKSSDLLLKNQNFDWYLQNQSVTLKNKQFLSKIYNNRYVGNYHFFVPNEGFTSEIPNEKKYDFSATENIPVKYRLLTIAKIIGAIDYLYPHNYLMDTLRDEHFSSLTKETVNCNSRKDFELILSKLIASMEDTHAFRFYKQLNYRKHIFHTSFFAPFDFKVFKDYILITDLIVPGFCKNLAIGDRITRINGKSISDMIIEKQQLLSSSNHNGLLHRLSDYQNNLIWTDDTPVKEIEVIKKNQGIIKIEIQLVANTDKSRMDTILAYLTNKIHLKNQRQLTHQDIVYFRIDKAIQMIEGVEDDKADAKMEQILDSAFSKKAIVFDMRGYPDWGGFVYSYIYNYFSPAENYFGKYYQQNLDNIGTYIHVKNSETYFPKLKTKKHCNPYKGQVFLIVDAETLSAGEWNTMNLQHIFPNAITIGNQTAGADGDIKKLQLPGNYLMEFTGNAIFYTDGTQAQKKGVKINHATTYSDNDIISKKDLPFEYIINQIQSF